MHPTTCYLLPLCLCGLVMACSTVRTTKPADGAVDAEASEGLTYYLPRKRVKFVATRTILDPKAIADALAKSKQEQATARQRAKENASAAASAEATYNKLNQNDAAKPDALKAWQLARAEAAVAADALALANATVAGLESQLADAQKADSDCVFSFTAKLELLVAESDPDTRLVAKMTHSAFRDDTLKLNVQSNGLLSTANAVATDRTGDVIVEIAAAVAAFGARGRAISVQLAKVPSAPPPCDKLPRSFQHILDPVTDNVYEINSALKEAKYPFRLDVLAPSRITKTADAKLDHVSNIRGAIYYRTPVPYVVTIRQCSDGTECGTSSNSSEFATSSQPIDSAIVLLPQAGPVSYIPMRSSAFVKTVNDVQFEDGIIKSWSAERPSGVMEFVRLPVKVLTALISVPAQILSLRVDFSSKEKSLAEAQLAEIQAAERLRGVKACIEEISMKEDKADDSALACFDD